MKARSIIARVRNRRRRQRRRSRGLFQRSRIRAANLVRRTCGLTIERLYFPLNSAGGGGAGQPAKDANGNDIKKASWLKTHLPGDYSLTQGLKGDATYLIVKADGSLTDFGLNAVCTHLGCVVPWNKAENKFKCPCHGSQYNADGKVIRGPAPLSLALAHVVIDGSDTVTFTPWTEQDFRTGLQPWWK